MAESKPSLEALVREFCRMHDCVLVSSMTPRNTNYRYTLEEILLHADMTFSEFSVQVDDSPRNNINEPRVRTLFRMRPSVLFSVSSRRSGHAVSPPVRIDVRDAREELQQEQANIIIVGIEMLRSTWREKDA